MQLFFDEKPSEEQRRELKSSGFKWAPSQSAWQRQLTKNATLTALLAEPWSNGACRGYVIYAMENCGSSPEAIQRVVGELHYVFDMRGLEEAEQHYQNSPY